MAICFVDFDNIFKKPVITWIKMSESCIRASQMYVCHIKLNFFEDNDTIVFYSFRIQTLIY